MQRRAKEGEKLVTEVALLPSCDVDAVAELLKERFGLLCSDRPAQTVRGASVLVFEGRVHRTLNGRLRREVCHAIAEVIETKSRARVEFLDARFGNQVTRHV